MSNFRLSVFDSFQYLLPGFVYQIFFFVEWTKFKTESLANITNVLSFYHILGVGAIAYIIGFLSDSIASKFHRFLVKIVRRSSLDVRVEKEFREIYPNSTLQEYNFGALYSFVDLKAPSLLGKADIWRALGNMARNLGLVFFLYGLYLVVAPFIGYSTFDLFLICKILVSFLFSILMTLRGDSFNKWGQMHLLHAYENLQQDK